VTADGRLLSARAEENLDLFWGLRGGGGNFGIVTSFTYQLHQIGPIIYGGMMVSLPERADETLRFLREYMADAPDDLGLGAAFISAPPEPFVPAEMHFAPVFGLVVCWTGDMGEGERVLTPIREAAQPVMDMVGPMPYAALQGMLDASGPPGISAYMKAEFLPELSDGAIAVLTDRGAARPGPLVQLLLGADGWGDRPRGPARDRPGTSRCSLVLPRAVDVDGAGRGGGGYAHRVGPRAGRRHGPVCDRRGVSELHL
jgi:hypothetical protein